MLEFIKKIRYTHAEDDSYLGLQVGTAQVIDIYEKYCSCFRRRLVRIQPLFWWFELY